MIAPSILNANNMHLANNINAAINSGINRFHIDIMDGHFVPNLSYGPELIKDLKKEFSNVEVEVHLMSNNLDQMIPLFVETGCDLLEFHIEAAQSNTQKWLNYLKENHVKAGIVLNPTTPIKEITSYLPSLDQLLLMTVIPGFGGQKFRNESASRIKEAKQIINKSHHTLPIEVDGGINNTTAKIAKDAGAEIFVAGSYIFNKNTIKQQIDELAKSIS